jgi:hypothetical protein
MTETKVPDWITDDDATEYIMGKWAVTGTTPSSCWSGSPRSGRGPWWK